MKKADNFNIILKYLLFKITNLQLNNKRDYLIIKIEFKI